MLATSAGLSSPKGIWGNSAGDIYFADSHRLRVVDSVTGIVSTVAGNGGNDSEGSSGLAPNTGSIWNLTGVCGHNSDSVTVFFTDAGSDKEQSGGAVYEVSQKSITEKIRPQSDHSDQHWSLQQDITTTSTRTSLAISSTVPAGN